MKAYTNVTADDWVMTTPTDPADVLALRDALSDLLDYTTGYINNKPTVCGQRYLDAARETLAATEQRARPSADVLAAVDGMLKAAKGDLVDARAYDPPRAYLADIDSAERHIDLARETLAATEQRARGQGSEAVCGKSLEGFVCDKDPHGPDIGHNYVWPATPPTPALTAVRLAQWEPFRKVIRDYTYQPFGQAEAQEMCARLIALATPPAPAAEVEG